jgi:acyl-CoA dehydrogenase
VKREIFDDEHDDFREMVRTFVRKEVEPYYGEWEEAGAPPRDIFRTLGSLGVLGMSIPEEFGGAGQSSYKYSAVLTEETMRAAVGLGTVRVHMDIVLPYLLHYCNDEQKQRWFPGLASGDLVLAIAMTEPATGSDLAGIATSAIRDGDEYVINGSKTFITGAINADLVLVVARTSRPTDDDRRAGLSLIVVPTDTPGFSRGKKLPKIGLKSQDTAELFFEDVRVPAANVLGEEGAAFSYLGHNLAQERLSIAVGSQAAAVGALEFAKSYVRERKVFGKTLGTFQNTKFVLAECAAELEAGQALVDKAIQAHHRGDLDAVDAAKVKLFVTELQGRVVDKTLQLFGGYGYITEYPIARLYADARVTRIYGGTSEVMKTIISKSLGI